MMRFGRRVSSSVVFLMVLKHVEGNMSVIELVQTRKDMDKVVMFDSLPG